jgi:hypothetical protein
LDDLSIRSDDASIDTGISDGEDAEIRQNDGISGDDSDDGDNDDGDLEGLRRLGRRLHQFDEIEHLFDNFAAELEWGNEDYHHDPLVYDDGEYASDD